MGRTLIVVAVGLAALAAVVLALRRSGPFESGDPTAEPLGDLEASAVPPEGLAIGARRGALAARPRLERPATRTVRVRLTGPQGPIEGARVTVYRRWADAAPWASISDREGRVRAADLGALTAGARVEAASEDFLTAYAGVDLEADAEIELPMVPAPSLEGRVVDAGTNEPIVGATVTWGWSDPAVLFSTAATPSTTTGSGGRFRIPPPERQFERALKATAPSYVDAAVQVLRWNGTTEPSPLAIRMRREGVIRGTVRTAAGDPVPGASVRYERVDVSQEHDDSAPRLERWTGRHAPSLQGEALASAGGEFELRSLVCGAAYQLRLRADGRPDTALPHRIQIDDATREAVVDARFGTPGAIRAQFVDPDGRPISGPVHVRCRPLDASREFDVEVEADDLELDARGACEFGGLGGGSHLVELDDPRWVRERRTVDVRPGRTEHVQFRVEDGRTLRGQVVGEDGQPVPGSTVHFYYADWFDDGARTRTPTPCDGTGRFQVKGFRPGPLFAFASAGEPSRRLQSLPQQFDDASERTFVLRAPSRVRMRLVREDGAPCGPPWGASGKHWASTLSPDPDGVVCFDVPPGCRTFRVRVADCATRTFPTDPRGGETLDLGDQRFEPGIEISGAAIGADGEPIDDVSVHAPATGERSTTDRAGRFRLRVPNDGEYRIEAFRPSRFFLPVVVDTSKTRTCVLRASRGAIVRVRLRETDGRAAASVAVELRPEGASPDDERTIRRVTDASGRCTCLVGPGRWSAFLARGASAFGVCEAEDGSTHDVDGVRPAR